MYKLLANSYALGLINNILAFSEAHKKTVFIICRVIVNVVIISFLYYWFAFNININNFDYKHFYGAGLILREGQAYRLYDLDFQLKLQQERVIKETHEMKLPFRNFALAAVPYIPLTYFDYITSYRIMVFIYLATIVGAILALKKDLIEIALLSTPFHFVIYQGQFNWHLLIVMLLIYYFLKKDAWLAVGLLSSLFILKLTFLVAIPFLFLLSSNKKFYIFGFFIGTILLLLSNQIITNTNFIDYINYVRITETTELGSAIDNMFSIQSFLQLFISRINSITISVFLYALTLIAFFFKIKEKVSKEYLFGVSLILFPTFMYHTYEQDLTGFIISLGIILGIPTIKFRIKMYIFACFAVLFTVLPYLLIEGFLGALILVAGLTLLVLPSKSYFLTKTTATSSA